MFASFPKVIIGRENEPGYHHNCKTRKLNQSFFVLDGFTMARVHSTDTLCLMIIIALLLALSFRYLHNSLYSVGQFGMIIANSEQL
jgi:hypothetical protein